MARVAVDPATGALRTGGKLVFPIGLSNPPPAGQKAPNGRDGFAELASAGATFVRTGMQGWSGEFLDGQIALERQRLDAAAEHGLRCWSWLGRLANLPERRQGQPPSPVEQQLTKVVTSLRSHPALLAYKGVDEPRNPFRGEDWLRPAGLKRAYTRVKELDPDHPLVIIQAPPSPVAQLVPYRPTFDVTGADVYPVAYPPGRHAGSDNHDPCVVGDVTRKLRAAAGSKPVWMTLQIAWSGILPSKSDPGRVPRFPTLHEERFMTYQAIANGARGVNYFGGHLTQVATPEDAALGWNWTFWNQVLRPVVRELSSPALAPALVAPDAGRQVTTKPRDSQIELVTRRTGRFLYVIAVRRGGPTSLVRFTGLPLRNDGKPLTTGRVLFEYTQQPPPPPVEPGRQDHRTITVADSGFADWFAPHDAHVYRFAL
jgi:hypothetical protein